VISQGIITNASIKIGEIRMKTTQLPKQKCVYCGKDLDAATHMEEDASPKPGDILICIGCAGILRYDGLHSVAVTDAEFRALPTKEQQEIARYQMAVKAVLEEQK